MNGSANMHPGQSVSVLLLLQHTSTGNLFVVDYGTTLDGKDKFKQIPHAVSANRVKVTLINASYPQWRKSFWYTLGFDKDGTVTAEQAGVDWIPPTVGSSRIRNSLNA